jgi:sulfur-oxidizing protein SoxB
MVRAGGLGYTIDPKKPAGRRISNMTLLKDGSAVDPAREYAVAGWASINQATEGPPIWDVVETYLKAHSPVRVEPNDAVKVTGV